MTENHLNMAGPPPTYAEAVGLSTLPDQDSSPQCFQPQAQGALPDPDGKVVPDTGLLASNGVSGSRTAPDTTWTIVHRGQGHSDGGPTDCKSCGMELAELLKTRFIRPQQGPKYNFRDVAIITGHDYVTQDSGLVRGLLLYHVSARILHFIDADKVRHNVKNDVTIAGSGVFRSNPLPAVTVFLQTGAASSFVQMVNSFPPPSHLVKITTPSPDDVNDDIGVGDVILADSIVENAAFSYAVAPGLSGGGGGGGGAHWGNTTTGDPACDDCDVCCCCCCCCGEGGLCECLEVLGDILCCGFRLCDGCCKSDETSHSASSNSCDCDCDCDCGGGDCDCGDCGDCVIL